MTPEQEIAFNQLTQQVKEMSRTIMQLSEYVEDKKRQQISYPLDEASFRVLSPLEVQVFGLGGTALTQVYTDSGGDTVTAPKAYADTILIKLSDGNIYEVPFLALNP